MRIPRPLVLATTSDAFETFREDAAHSRRKSFEIDLSTLDAADTEHLLAVACRQGNGRVERALRTILESQGGQFERAVPNFDAFADMLIAYLRASVIDGWIYVTGDDGLQIPQLVTHVTHHAGDEHYGRRGTPHVVISTVGFGLTQDGNYRAEFRSFSASHSFAPADVVNRKLPKILKAQGLARETAELKARYVESMARHHALVRGQLGQQFRLSGRVYRYDEEHWRRREDVNTGHRVIQDLGPADVCGVPGHHESTVASTGVGSVPEQPIVRVFDLATHETCWVHGDTLSPHVYDDSLRDKLVLPASHRDLLDVLTTDIHAFTDDLIEGKRASNVILCKGPPGVGKTLSAEVYAELIKRPLLSLRTGSLGTSAEAIEKSLAEFFRRARRWNCVLLLDEADVFISERGDDIEKNAIVAVFLRTLEYFDGLLFMTTNRPNDIDEAIVSRCAAIIEYAVPSGDDMPKVWRVLANQFNASMPDWLIDELAALFSTASPRDIKMLLRLALKVQASTKVAFDQDLFRRCAMFRAVKIADAPPVA